MKDNRVCVIGLGPAGVSASIYLKRYGMEPICYERELIGGKVNKTEMIENYAGIPYIKGMELAACYENQIERFNIQVRYEEVIKLSLNDDNTFLVETKKHKDNFKYVIIANGLGERPFPIKGEDEFLKRGISRCAICDGNFYKGKEVCVIGAGNSAFEEATYLSTICSFVTLIARRKEFRADKSVVDNFKNRDNTKILSPYNVVSCKGSDTIEELTIQNRDTNEILNIKLSGLFLYVGEVSDSSFVQIPNIKDENGFFITNERKETKVKNLYAVGDTRITPLRQVVTSSSDGALAASFIFEEYQKEN